MKNLIPVSVTALMLSAMSVTAQESFNITGRIPGIKAGNKIELVNRDSRSGDSGWHKIEGTAADGSFTLTGSVDMPMLCEVRISDPDNEESMGYAFELMVENAPIEVSAACLDSLPPSFYSGTSGLYRMKNLTVKGGEAQREYEEYCAAIFPYDVAVKQAHYNLYWDEKRDRTPEGKSKLSQLYDDASVALDGAKDSFMKSHPTYHISAMLWLQSLSVPFAYSSAELDGIWSKVNGNNSPVRVAMLEKAVADARKYERGSMYADFSALAPDSVRHSISEYAGRGNYVMVDFWASWCGPCRASIPHVRDLYNKYRGKLDVCSVSVDEDAEAWRMAMEQEKMEWAQMRVPKEDFKAVTDAYNFHSIPFMVLIDPQGRVVFAGHEPAKVSAVLSAAID